MAAKRFTGLGTFAGFCQIELDFGSHRKSTDLVESDFSIFVGFAETFSLGSYEGLKLQNWETFYGTFLTQKSVTFLKSQNWIP